jgi:energy-converting hydrogenase Eha subunit A
VSILPFLATICIGVIASIGIGQPAFAQDRPSVSHEVCKIFSSTHLTECGGSARNFSIGATWISEGSVPSMAAFNSTTISNLADLQFTQNLFATRWQEAGASIAEPPMSAKGCSQTRLVIASSATITEAHGTGICHGFAVNFFVSGTLFSDQIVARFKNAAAALDIDKINHP